MYLSGFPARSCCLGGAAAREWMRSTVGSIIYMSSESRKFIIFRPFSCYPIISINPYYCIVASNCNTHAYTRMNILLPSNLCIHEAHWLMVAAVAGCCSTLNKLDHSGNPPLLFCLNLLPIVSIDTLMAQFCHLSCHPPMRPYYHPPPLFWFCTPTSS